MPVPTVGTFEVHPDALHTAAAALLHVASLTASTPDGLLVGTHDTHAAALDAALDEFRASVGREMQALVDRADTLSAMFSAAGSRFGALESALAAALSS
jgi:hypothetical protein